MSRTPPTLFWCDRCNKAVEPTSHAVTESTEFWGEQTWEAFEEKRCSLCRDVVAEEIACFECKEARPEDGCDHCDACLKALEQPVTNRTGAYLRAHADIESEEALRDPAQAPSPDPTFTPFSVVYEIAQYIRERETATHELVGQIRWIGGKPVISIAREPKPQGLDAFLRLGSDVALFRRQA
jgi:hypothetical protein